MKRRENQGNVQQIKLTAEQANRYLLRNASRPEYISEEVDDATGVDHDITLHHGRNGRGVLTVSQRSGGFYYLGDLLGSIICVAAFIACVWQLIVAICANNIADILTFLFCIISSGSFSYICIRFTVFAFRYKQGIKRQRAKGLIPKEKRTTGKILSRGAIFCFLSFFIWAFLNIVLDITGHGFSEKVTETGIFVIAGAFVLLCLILLIRGLIAEGKTVKKWLSSK